jgi:hypothetical protein
MDSFHLLVTAWDVEALREPCSSQVRLSKVQILFSFSKKLIAKKLTGL